MFRIMDAAQAAGLISDNAVIGLNSFAAMANPEKLHDAITKRFRETGHPRNLTLISSSGFGLLDPERGAEELSERSLPAITEPCLQSAGLFWKTGLRHTTCR